MVGGGGLVERDGPVVKCKIINNNNNNNNNKIINENTSINHM